MSRLAPRAALKMFAVAACDICGGVTQLPLYDFAFDGEKAGIVRCTDCGLVYSSPRPTPAALGDFYGHSYYSFGPPKLPDLGAKLSFKERLRRTILARHLGYSHLDSASRVPDFVTRQLAKFLVMPRFQAGGVLLDVGCGSGERMLELHGLGWRVEGLEFSESAAAAGRAAGLTISVGDLTTSDFAPGQFTMISFYHSLEHLYSPSEALRAAYQLLCDDGQLLIAVPNFGSSERRLFGKNWGWLQMPTHLFHFDRKTLKKLVAGAGFTDIDLRYSFHGYSVDTAMFGALRNVVDPLLKIFALAAALVGDGKALTLVARKPG